MAGINLSGGYATFPGVAGTAVTRVCNVEIGRTGLTEHEASAAGFEYVVARIDVPTTKAPGYLPEAPSRDREAARRIGERPGCSVPRSSAERDRPSASTSLPHPCSPRA